MRPSFKRVKREMKLYQYGVQAIKSGLEEYESNRNARARWTDEVELLARIVRGDDGKHIRGCSKKFCARHTPETCPMRGFAPASDSRRSRAWWNIR